MTVLLFGVLECDIALICLDTVVVRATMVFVFFICSLINSVVEFCKCIVMFCF